MMSTLSRFSARNVGHWLPEALPFLPGFRTAAVSTSTMATSRQKPIDAKSLRLDSAFSSAVRVVCPVILCVSIIRT
jgi:hypothetical protein